MKILEIKVLKGPNYWSVRRTKLIQMKLDLEELEQHACPGAGACGGRRRPPEKP